MNHSPKMMWMCVAIVLVAVVTVALDTPAVLAFALACLLMMAAMGWMMSGRSHRGGDAR